MFAMIRHPNTRGTIDQIMIRFGLGFTGHYYDIARDKRAINLHRLRRPHTLHRCSRNRPCIGGNNRSYTAYEQY